MLIKFKFEEISDKWLVDWVDAFNANLNSNVTIKDNTVIFPEDIADGTFSYHILAEGLAICTFNVAFKIPIDFERLASKNSDIYTLHINCSSQPVENIVNGKKGKIGGAANSSLFWSSSDTEVTLRVQPNQKIEAVLISMTKEYLENALWQPGTSNHACILQNDADNTCILRDNGLHKCILKDNKAKVCILQDNEHIISSSLYAQMGSLKYKLAQEIIQYRRDAIMPEKIILKGNVLKILALFIRRVAADKKNENDKTLHFNDASKIMEIKKLIEDNADNRHFTLEELSKIAGMSKTKLKIEFKEITGSSIYKYYIDVRMEKAKELLRGNPHSITDIAYSMGFKTVSHFSQLFKKHFGINPKSIILSAREAQMNLK